MMTLFAAVAALDAVAANRPAMPFFQQVENAENPTKGNLKLIKGTFLICLCLLFSLNVTVAQDLDTLSASDYNLRATTSSGFVNAGETALIQIELGDGNSSLSDAVELEIELELDAGVAFPTAPEATTPNSWFFDQVSPAISVSGDPMTATLTVSGTASPAASGDGNIFDIVLKAGSRGINADQMVKSLGGIVIVEDIGYKRRKPEVDKVTRVYPNPFQGRLNFRWGDTPPNSVRILNQQGALVSELTPREIQQGYWEAPQLPPGIYHSQFIYSESTDHFRLVKY